MKAASEASILLIDDDKDVCRIMRHGLERYGFHVTAYSNPTEALSQYLPKHYAKIILDVRMPGIEGFHLAKKIWSMDPEAKIYFFSAFDMYEREAKVLFKDLKASYFIKKPIAPADLARCLLKTQSLANKLTQL
jgi:two-component system, LuxR family, response regulator FixJ